MVVKDKRQQNSSKQEQGGSPSAQRGLSLRSFLFAVFSLLLMGIWIEYEEIYCYYGGPLAENSPPNSAVMVMLVVLAIGAALYRFRKSFRLVAAELIFIYAALLIAAPLMTQGMWHRFFGLVAAIPHEQDFKTYESLPSMLWPHGKNLCVNGRFIDGLRGFTFSGNGKLEWGPAEWQGKKWTTPTLNNGENQTGRSSLVFSVDRRVKGREVLVPGESFLLSLLVKADDTQGNSSYFVRMRPDSGPASTVIINSGNTIPTHALPSGFQRVGVCPLTIPKELKDKLTFSIVMSGPGRLALQDVQLFNSQAVEGAYSGRNVVKRANLDRLGASERNFTQIKPDRMLSFAGLKYIMTGFIPLDQWYTPFAAWLVLIGALFMGFFALNVIMRKQWSENERFSFPMNILPRHLFAQDADDSGKENANPLFRSRAMWIGFYVTLLLVVLKGVHFYFPSVPAPLWSDIWNNAALSTYVTNPLLQSFLQSAGINLVFCLLAIALMVEADVLFSIWVSFFLFQLVHPFGQVFGFNAREGYPWVWQQSAGAFIGLAFVTLFIARRHLWSVLKHIVGLVKLDDSGEAVSYRTAAVMLLVAVVALAFWGQWTGTGVVPSLVFFGYVIVCGLAASKIRAEAGLPYGYWMPYFGMMFAGAAGGFGVLGSTGMLVATIASGFMFPTCFLFIAPVQVELMELGRQCGVRLRDVGYGLGLGLLGGIIIGGFVMMCWTYGFGADNLATSYSFNQSTYFNGFRERSILMDRAVQSGEPTTSPKTAPFDVVNNVDAKGVGIGFVVTCILAVLRSAFTWFPLHPLGYVVASTYFGMTMWFTCFVAWFARSLVLRIGGAHAVRKGLVPFAIGMFLACVTSIILFDIVGILLRLQGITSVYSGMP